MNRKVCFFDLIGLSSALLYSVLLREDAAERPNRQRKRSRARNTCRLIIKSDKVADLQNRRRPEVFYRSVVLLSIRDPRGHVESRWSRRGSIICLELFDDVPDMGNWPSFRQFLHVGRSVCSDSHLGSASNASPLILMNWKPARRTENNVDRCTVMPTKTSVLSNSRSKKNRLVPIERQTR